MISTVEQCLFLMQLYLNSLRITAIHYSFPALSLCSEIYLDSLNYLKIFCTVDIILKFFTEW